MWRRMLSSFYHKYVPSAYANHPHTPDQIMTKLGVDFPTDEDIRDSFPVRVDHYVLNVVAGVETIVLFNFSEDYLCLTRRLDDPRIFMCAVDKVQGLGVEDNILTKFPHWFDLTFDYSDQYAGTFDMHARLNRPDSSTGRLQKPLLN